MAKAAQRQALVKVDGIDDYFATKTGGEVSGDTSKAWDGGKKTPTTLGGPALPGPIKVSRPFDPERDAPVIKRLRPRVNRDTFTVSVQWTDRDLVALAIDPDVYSNCLLTSVNDPEVDAASGDPAMFELTFEPEDVS